jgi:hypothetical protein
VGNLKLWFVLAVIVLGALRSANAQAGPRIFFTDIVSGPNSGGENGNGVYVTIYGNGFGASRGSSTVSLNGSTSALSVVSWGTPWRWYQKIVVQLLPSASTGNVIVTANSQSSNAVPFTVRAGNIYCVSVSGNDSNAGRFPSSCWRSIPKAKNAMLPGDTTYIENGVSQTSLDDYNSVLSISGGNATAANPIGLVAYPGASVTLSANLAYTIRTPAVSGSKDYWVLAGLTISGADGLDLVGVTGWRVIGNDFSCPTGAGQTACMHTDSTTNYYFYGNYVHNVGDANGSIDKYYHAVYFTTNSNHVWAAWNEVAPNPNGVTTSGGCRAIQFYSTGGSDQFDLHVHDNRIHDSICDGLNFATVNPNNGPVEAYNNVIYHVGTGPDPVNGSSNYSCITLGSSSGPTVPADIYNNTMYDCGPRKTNDSGGFAFGIPARLRNNVIQQLTGEYYLNPNNSSCTPLSGSNNEWYGVGNGPCATQLTTSVNANPMYLNPAIRDFHLLSGSPAVNAGVSIAGLSWDIDGATRPSGSAYDIGAYELGGAAVSRPNPPTNLQVVVQ